jgi:hypothetical protein
MRSTVGIPRLQAGEDVKGSDLFGVHVACADRANQSPPAFQP